MPRKATMQELREFKSRTDFINQIRAHCPEMGNRMCFHSIQAGDDSPYIRLGWLGYPKDQLRGKAREDIDKMDDAWIKEEMPALPTELIASINGEDLLIMLVHEKEGAVFTY